LFGHGFSAPIFRVERRKGDGRDLGKVVKNVPFLCCGQEREIDRILVGFLRREGAASSTSASVAFSSGSHL